MVTLAVQQARQTVLSSISMSCLRQHSFVSSGVPVGQHGSLSLYINISYTKLYSDILYIAVTLSFRHWGERVISPTNKTYACIIGMNDFPTAYEHSLTSAGTPSSFSSLLLVNLSSKG